MNLVQYDVISSRGASRKLARAAVLLNRAGRALESASKAAPDRHHRDRLYFFASGLRELSLPYISHCVTPRKGGFMSALWRDHLAAARQQSLTLRNNRSGSFIRATQADVLLAMLREAQAERGAVELPAIMAAGTAGIAQHDARFNELRSRGFVIRNETKRSDDGRTLSRYYLEHDPKEEGSL